MIKGVYSIYIREWKRILTLPVHYVVLLVVPVIICTIYALIYNNKFAQDLPVAVWDESHSPLSRQFTFMLEETESIHITRQVNSYAEIEALMKSGEILAAVHFPPRMDNDIKSRHPTTVTLYANAASLVTSKLIYKDAAQVIITAGSGVILQKFVKTGMPAGRAMALVLPVNLHSWVLYNPRYDYQAYLVPGLIAVALQMMIIMVAILTLNYERSLGTLEELRGQAGGSASVAIMGKSLAHLSMAWVNYLLVTCIMFPIFAGGLIASNWPLFVMYTLLAVACIGFGMMVSSIFNDVMLACDIGLFYTSPAFVFSGFTFPRWGMPWFDQYYAMLMPFTPFLDSLFKVYFMRLPLLYCYKEMGHLLLFIVLTYPVAIIVFQRKLNKLVVQHA
ncbi:ABC transporter permease [Chitinophaga sp. sic0106]|uniref:ABC transporter permease n=1 Tax=Chitinophaga sp. sic0106 TaxID=2854785 RepID=UPI001C476945|nr:ABC transporter permease [Chitinophaga sp. sic0106]MBV7530101.1 ABC transporter permease [Chitinophaga sp. sic0106]